ncbi:MAG TPA: sulfite exporter TauE/SafE family protein [Luteitalea sp.]|nr:sulfite exporter TauE/SafE family protein [Luteitalea sp.]
MALFVIAVVACAASALTFVSGFGLGTLLMPVFAWFMPLEQAIATTGVVHFLNSLFKFALVGRRAHWPVVWRFGIPALLASLLGAWWLVQLSERPPLTSYALGGRVFEITEARLLISVLLATFVLVEWVPRWKALTVPARWMPLGGILSGLAGGISGMQGALRSAFLARAGMDKTTFVATGVAIACLIDVSRVGVYASMLRRAGTSLDLGVLGTAVTAALAGAVVGRHYLESLTMEAVRSLIAVLLLVMAVAMAAGLL